MEIGEGREVAVVGVTLGLAPPAHGPRTFTCLRGFDTHLPHIFVAYFCVNLSFCRTRKAFVASITEVRISNSQPSFKLREGNGVNP